MDGAVLLSCTTIASYLLSLNSYKKIKSEMILVRDFVKEFD